MENAWGKKLLVEKPDSVSVRSFSAQAAGDSYDELLQHMKRTTVESISVDEEEEEQGRDVSKKKKATHGPPAKAGGKPFPFPSPIIIGSTPAISLAPSCDISPHSALRIAPGISSGLFAAGASPAAATSGAPATTGSSVPGTSPKAGSGSGSGSAPLAMPLQVSPKVSSSAPPPLLGGAGAGESSQRDRARAVGLPVARPPRLSAHLSAAAQHGHG
jgi:hypothetical protein